MISPLIFNNVLVNIEWLENKMCLWNTYPRWQQSQISKSSYILTRPNPKGHVMLITCEQPFDQLTVQVWYLKLDLCDKHNLQIN